MKSGFFDASFSNKAVALETDQTDTASLRHRRPRIFAALLAGIGLVLIVGGSRLLMLGGSLYYLVAGLRRRYRKLAWAWDVGRPERHGEPPPGDSYTRSTPNSWATMSADEKLGLVYVPTGNATLDFYGGQRRPFDEAYASSVVAIDALTGEVRWKFQAVHHDLWDYDAGSQPTLVDIPTASGVQHALIQPTKQGDIFLLDRETGAPLADVRELSTSQEGLVPGERLSPTQPFSVGMPSFRGPDLREQDMWGVTPLDQLSCRIMFKETRYNGPYTPPGLTTSIQYPGPAGGFDWGMTYTSPAGRQFVVIAAGGSSIFRTKRGDYVMAYALPE